MILQPAWKLLNVNLSIYTEVVGYDRSIEFSEEERESLPQDEVNGMIERGIESEDENENYGVYGMTLHLIELLTTLVGKGSVQTLVGQGLIPLITSVSSLMIMTKEQESQYVEDPNQYVSEDDDELILSSVRNNCLDFISQLIECFDYDAVEAILFVAEKLIISSNEMICESSESTASIEIADFENIDVMQYNYDSNHQNHKYKKREVGLLLIGTISEDI